MDSIIEGLNITDDMYLPLTIINLSIIAIFVIASIISSVRKRNGRKEEDDNARHQEELQNRKQEMVRRRIQREKEIERRARAQAFEEIAAKLAAEKEKMDSIYTSKKALPDSSLTDVTKRVESPDHSQENHVSDLEDKIYKNTEEELERAENVLPVSEEHHVFKQPDSEKSPFTKEYSYYQEPEEDNPDMEKTNVAESENNNPDSSESSDVENNEDAEYIYIAPPEL